MPANSRTNRNRTNAGSAKAQARETGASLPTDHKQSASHDVYPDIVEFKYKGKIFEVNTDDFDDLEIMESVQVSLTRGLPRLLGREQYEELVELQKATDAEGRLRISQMRDFFTKMQDSIGPLL